MIADASDTMLLVTIRARFDPDFPAALFLSLRRYFPDVDPAQKDVLVTANVDEAMVVVRGWLRDLGKETLE